MTFELFGTVRLRAGVGQVEVEATTLGAAIARLAEACPALDGPVIAGSGVHPAFRLSLNGDRFVSGADTGLAPGDRLLLLSADAGG